MEENLGLLDFPIPEDLSKRKIIKVVGVGGGGCNAASNMFREGIDGVSFCVCDTNTASLNSSPVPHKVLLGKTGLGAGADPERGRKEAELNVEELQRLFSDGTQMAFITAGMGSGTGTGAAPFVAGVARQMGILTIGIVTLPFYFEKRRKILKALKGLEEMRKNVDALLIINNQQICNVYNSEHIPVTEAFRRADQVLCNATRSISELITITGNIDTDFRDVETTMRNGGGAIMAMGRASGQHRVEKAFEDALNSPLLYGSDIDKAQRILFNIYTSSEAELYVDEMDEIDAFTDSLNPDIDVIWGIAQDDTLGQDVKLTILATGFENKLWDEDKMKELDLTDGEYLNMIIEKLYGKGRRKQNDDIRNMEKQEMKELADKADESHEQETDSVIVDDNDVEKEELPSSKHIVDKMKDYWKKFSTTIFEDHDE